MTFWGFDALCSSVLTLVLCQNMLPSNAWLVGFHGTLSRELHPPCGMTWKELKRSLRFSDSWLAALKLWGLLSAARCRTRASSSLWSFKLGSADPAPIRHVWPQILICQEHEKGSHAWPVLSFALARYRIARHRANLLGSASRSGTPGISRGKKNCHEFNTGIF